MKVRRWKCIYCKKEYIVSIKSRFHEDNYICPMCEYEARKGVREHEATKTACVMRNHVNNYDLS